MTWFKNSNILVLRRDSDGGLELLHQTTKQIRYLDPQQAADFWVTWDVGYLEKNNNEPIMQELISSGFIVNGRTQEVLFDTIVDSQVPEITDKHIKWYEESPDLTV